MEPKDVPGTFLNLVSYWEERRKVEEWSNTVQCEGMDTVDRVLPRIDQVVVVQKKKKKRKFGGFELGTMSVQSNKPNHWSAEDQRRSLGKIA